MTLSAGKDGPAPNKLPQWKGQAPQERDARRLPRAFEALILGSGVFGNIAMSSLAPALPAIQANLAGADTALSLNFLFSAVGLGVITSSVATGALVRKFGRQRVLVSAYGVFAVFGTIGAVLPNLDLIIASRVIVGGAGAVIVALGLILIGDFFEGRSRERRMGLYHAIASLALAGLMPLAGLLADVHWRLTFLIHLVAVPMLLLGIAARPGNEERPAESHQNVRSHLPPAVIGIMVMTLVAGGIIYSIQIFMPLHLSAIPGSNGLIIGASLSASVIAMLVTSLLYSEVRRFVSVTPLFGVSLIILAAGLFTIANTTTVGGTILGMAITGVAGGFFGPTLFSAVSALSDEASRPHAVGLTKGIYYFGPFAGPMALQLAGVANDPEVALSVLSFASVGLGALCALCIPFVRSPILGRTS